MFTGIIQAVGHIHSLTEKGGGDVRVTIAGGGLNLGDVALGDSIACNGVCLTVVDKTPESFSVDVSGETFSCTIGFAPGDRVNLEKAMRLSDRLGGHLVSGHVDGVGVAVRRLPDGGHEVQPQQREVRQIVPAEGLVVEMGVDAAQAVEAAGGRPVVIGGGDHDPPVVADHHMRDPALAIHQQADLAADFVRQLAQVARQLGGHQAFRRSAPAVEIFEPADLVGLEAGGVAENSLHYGSG